VRCSRRVWWRGVTFGFLAHPPSLPPLPPSLPSYASGLWVSVDLNKALAVFLRDLFLLLHPSQLALLVSSYFSTLHSCTRTEQMEAKFEFLDILLMHDSVPFNKPWYVPPSLPPSLPFFLLASFPSVLLNYLSRFHYSPIPSSLLPPSFPQAL